MGFFDGSGRFKTALDGIRLLRQTWSAWLKALKPIGPWTVPAPPITPVSVGGSGSVMTPKEIHSLVIERAKHGALIDRCALTVYYIANSVGFVLCVLPFPAMFVPREYITVTALGAALAPFLLAWAIFAWLKRRLLTDEELSRQSLSAWLKEPDPPVTPAPKRSD